MTVSAIRRYTGTFCTLRRWADDLRPQRSFARPLLAIVTLGACLAILPLAVLDAAPVGHSPLAKTAAPEYRSLDLPARPGPETRRYASSKAMYRVIVQFDPASDRNGEIRRILGALKGLPHKVARTFDYTPAVVLEVDKRGLKRLRRLRGVTLQMDEASPPT